MRSLLGNWRREAERFTPELKVLVIHGPHRGAAFMEICNHDLVITSYALIRKDIALYSDLEFHYVILDEAQFIKNAAAQTTLAIQGLKARHRLCLTGTPLENHLGELWSIFHFLMPGFLGTQDSFSRLFRTPIEKNGDLDRLTGLKRRLAPFMLRRTKDLVEKDLPEKTEIVRMATLEGRQRELYETVRIAMDKKIRDEIAKKGLARSHITILDALLKLRQVCCDPRLLKLDGARKVKQSAVIHYDPWWNPAVERQATDRARRIGQDKPVFVYKLLTENTVEEKILMLQQKKMALAEGICGRDGETSPQFSAEDLLELFGTGPG